MVGKFLLVFFLARILQPEDVGTYGILAATVGYALQLIGLDFYTYSSRAMLHAEKNMWPAMLRDQAALFVCSYLVVFPALGLMFSGGLLPTKYLFVFYVLLVVEHLSQELSRLLVIIGQPLLAGVAMFVRSGVWCYLLVAMHLGGLINANLHTVLWMWVSADAAVLAGGVWLLRKLPWEKNSSGVNWLWILNGLKVGLLFFIGTLALRGVFTLDRYFVEIFSGLEVLGVYTLYIGICFSLIAFVDAAIFCFRYPLLVSLYKLGDHGAFKTSLRNFRRQTLIASTVLASAIGGAIVPLLEWVGKPVYLQHLPSFFVLLAAAFVFAISHIPHFALYAVGGDRSIVSAHMAGFASFTVFCLLLVPSYEMNGVAIALLLAVSVVAGLKQWRFVVFCRGNGRRVAKT